MTSLNEASIPTGSAWRPSTLNEEEFERAALSFRPSWEIGLDVARASAVIQNALGSIPPPSTDNTSFTSIPSAMQGVLAGAGVSTTPGRDFALPSAGDYLSPEAVANAPNVALASESGAHPAVPTPIPPMPRVRSAPHAAAAVKPSERPAERPTERAADRLSERPVLTKPVAVDEVPLEVPTRRSRGLLYGAVGVIVASALGLAVAFSSSSAPQTPGSASLTQPALTPAPVTAPTPAPSTLAAPTLPEPAPTPPAPPPTTAAAPTPAPPAPAPTPAPVVQPEPVAPPPAAVTQPALPAANPRSAAPRAPRTRTSGTSAPRPPRAPRPARPATNNSDDSHGAGFVTESPY